MKCYHVKCLRLLRQCGYFLRITIELWGFQYCFSCSSDWGCKTILMTACLWLASHQSQFWRITWPETTREFLQSAAGSLCTFNSPLQKVRQADFTPWRCSRPIFAKTFWTFMWNLKKSLNYIKMSACETEKCINALQNWQNTGNRGKKGELQMCFNHFWGNCFQPLFGKAEIN